MAEDGLRIAETVNHPFSLIEACHGVSVVYLRQGDVQRAIPVLERAMGLCQDWHILLFLPWHGRSPGPGVCPGGACRRGSGAGGTRGGASRSPGADRGVWRPRSPASARRICWLAAWKTRANAPRRLSSSPASTSNAATRPGRCGSWARARRARRPQRSSPPPATTARPSPWPRSWACARSRPTATAAWGCCTPRSASRSQARAELSTAIEMYRTMAMTFWLPQAEAALAQVEGQMG